ncbi:MAG: hypothetical protein C0498_12655 [Anaerolinea sp.]|nr:hypothetical protein [Anaerolinea sp.]
MNRLLAAARSAAAASVAALANPGVRRVQAAWLLGFTADTALLVLLAVTAFAAAGAVGVAVLGAARMLPSTVFGFLAAAPLGRWRGDRVLLGLAVARGLAALGAIGVILAGADVLWLYAVAAVTGAADALGRPAQHTVLPALATTPGELVTANVASSTGEAIGSFAGPLIAAACIALGVPAAAAIAALAAQALGAIALFGIRFEHAADERGPETREPGGGLRIAVGFAAIRRRPAIGLVIVGFSAQTLVRGLLATLIVVLSTELVGLGEPGVGLLNAAIGVGGMAGMIGGLALRRSTPLAYTAALAAWGLPIAIIGVAPAAGVALVALAAVGLANALLDIVGFTLLQRGCRNEERGAVFAIFEGAVGIGATVGSLGAPLLIDLLGSRAALVGTGVILPAAAVILGLLFRRLGHAEVVSTDDIEHLQRVPAFRVLPLTGLERLVASAVPVSFRAGDVLMRKGEAGDRFLVIDTGNVEVSDDGRVLDLLGPGAGIGEIALLRGGPRTATVTALTDVTAQAFDAAAFLAAVSGPGAASAITRVVDERLTRSATD